MKPSYDLLHAVAYDGRLSGPCAPAPNSAFECGARKVASLPHRSTERWMPAVQKRDWRLASIATYALASQSAQ